MLVRMAGNLSSHPKILKGGARPETSPKQAVQGWMAWISPKPSMKKVELLAEDLREESKS